MKLNLGCGSDIRLGYVNYDIAVNSPNVVKADITNPDTYKDVPDNSVDEIVMIHVAQFITSDVFPILLDFLRNKMTANGSIWIQSYDYLLLANDIKFGQTDLTAINEVLYGKNRDHRAIYELTNIINLLKAKGFTITEYGYGANNEFYVSVKK